MRQLLLLGLLDLPEQGGLVRCVVPDQYPPAGLVAHLPGASRDRPGRFSHGFIPRVEEGDDLPGLGQVPFDFEHCIFNALMNIRRAGEHSLSLQVK